VHPEGKQYVSNHDQALEMSTSSGDNLDYIRRDCSKVRKSFCGWEAHVRTRCPARSATCFKCKGKGHWSKTCTNTISRGAQYSSKAEMVDCEEMDGLFLGDDSL